MTYDLDGVIESWYDLCMNPINAIRFLRSIDFPADPIDSHYFFQTADAAIADELATAIHALFNRSLIDLNDSDFDALDDALYPPD